MSAPTDEHLLQEFLAGQRSGFEQLVRRYSKELYQFVLRFTGESMAAEDVVQETFLQVYNSARNFDPARRFKPWLFTIAANKARDHLRRLNRRREVSFEAQLNRGDMGGQRFIDLLAGVPDTPDDDLQNDEKRRTARRIMEAMPEKLSEVLILAYYHRFPYREIAEILGIPLGTVKSRLHAAVVYFGERYREAVPERTDSP